MGFPERQFRRRPKHPNHLVKVKENHIMKSYLAILPAALLLLAAAGCASAKPGEPAEPVCAVRAADVQLGDKLL